jgi:protein-S-isoprenylcysteine O-methyltransferase Ste14
MSGWLPILVMLLVGFYWGRVVKLVLKQRRLGQSANFLPPETVGRVIRIIWYPTVAVWILAPLLTWAWPRLFSSRPWPLEPLMSVAPFHWAAFAVACGILYLTMICWRKMGRDWRMGIDPDEKNNLIVTGPYAHVRHPIYALQQLFAVFTFLAVPSPVMLAVMVLEIVLLTWEAVREERHLLSVHGDTYRQYMKTSGRFIPRPARA